MADNWYCKIMGEEFGPIPFSDVSHMFLRGELSPEDYVKEGPGGKWMHAKAISKLTESPDAAIAISMAEMDILDVHNQANGKAEEYSLDDFETSNDLGFAAAERATPMPANKKSGNGIEKPRSQPSARDWYCLLGGAQSGPFSWEQMQRMAAQGKIEADDSVRHESDSEWIPATRVVGLFPARPKGETRRVTSDRSAASTPTWNSSETDPVALGRQFNEMLIQFEGLLSRFETLFQNNTGFVVPGWEPPAGFSRPSGGGGASDAATEEPNAGLVVTWYYQEDGKERGPISLDDLLELVNRKKVLVNDKIRMGEDGEWFPAGAVDGLFEDMSGYLGAAGVSKETQLTLQALEKMLTESNAPAEAKPVEKGAAAAPASTEVAPRAAAQDILRNMGANTIRQADERAKRAKENELTFGEQVKEQLTPKNIAIAVTVLVALGFYMIVAHTMRQAAYRSAYSDLEKLYTEVSTARSSGGEAQLKELAEKSNKVKVEVLKKVKGASKGSAGNYIAQAARLLEELVLNSIQKDAASIETATQTDETYQEYMTRARKKLGLTTKK